HTRFSRDWSSDVCSSDLALSPDVVQTHSKPIAAVLPLDPEVEKIARFLERRAAGTIDPLLRRHVAAVVVEEARLAGFDPLFVLRSEGRRVGTERRARRAV